MDDMVVRALHAARQHFDEGGFLDSLRGMFSGPDYQSNGKEASFANMPTQEETNADFFKADRAARLAREVMAQQPQADTRPVIPERAVEQAPALTVPGPTQLRVNPNPSPAMKALLTQADGSSIPDNAMALAPDKLADRAAPEAIKIADRATPDQSAADAVWARMLRQESGNRQFDRNGRTITSPVGALGISQVMPSTGPEAARLAGLPWSLDRLRNDPEYNEALGRAYFDTQLARFGDPALAAAAYNGGPGRVAQAIRKAQATGRPYTDFLRPETQHYVTVVSPQARADGGEVDGVDQALDVVQRQPMTPASLARAWTPPEEAIAADVGPRASEFMQNYPEKLYSGIADSAKSMLETAKLPGQVMSGERSFDPHSDEDIRKAMDLAMMAQSGGIGGASARAGETVLGSGPVRLSPANVSIKNEGNGLFRVFHGNENAGTISVAKDGAGNFVSAASLNDPFIGKGIGNTAYSLIENEIGRKLAPSPLGISPTATKFWQKRLKEMSPEDQANLFAQTREAGKSYGLPERDVNLRLRGIGAFEPLSSVKTAEYPMAPKTNWYGDANYQQTGGALTKMTPDDFLAKARPMKIDEVARENIDDLKRHILEGGELDPLALYKNGKEDGRHRAIAARELGIQEVPVLRWENVE